MIDATKLGFGIRPAPVKTIYKEDRRKSHFRPIADSTHITLMVAKKLFTSMGNFPGLAKVLRSKARKTNRKHQSERRL